eukprot:3298627-Amphidinium_carterae.1
MQSIDDKEYYDNREREEREDPAGWTRSRLETTHTDMMDEVRIQQARERREERKRGRFKGSLEDLTRMRDALRDILITGRRQRLQARVPAAKAAPAGIHLPYHHKPLNELTLQELRAKVRHEEECAERAHGGAYVAPPIPNLQ